MVHKAAVSLLLAAPLSGPSFGEEEKDFPPKTCLLTLLTCLSMP